MVSELIDKDINYLIKSAHARKQKFWNEKD